MTTSMDGIVDLFRELGIFDIDQLIVDSISDSEFTEEQEVEIKFLDLRSLKLLKKCIRILRGTITKQSNQSLWKVLTENKLPTKHLQVWIYSVLIRGIKTSSCFIEKQACLLAANLYYLMLTLSASKQQYFFHCIIFEKALITFDIIGNVSQLQLKRKADGSSNQQRKKPRQTRISSSDQTVHEDEEIVLSASEVDDILMHTKECLLSFNYLLNAMALREQQVSLMHAVRTIGKLISYFARSLTCALTEFNLSSNCGALESNDNPMYLIYHALYLLNNPKHGDVETTSLIVLKRLLNPCLMQDTTPFTSVAKAYIHSSNTAFNFILKMFCKTENEAIMNNVRDFLQNVVVQNSDRAEYRTHMSEAVSTLIINMPYTFYISFTNWLIKTLQHAKTSYRSNALIVVGHLLCLPLHEGIEESDGASHKHLLQSVMHRMVDMAATVRTRALSVIVEIMQNKVVSPETLLEAADTSKLLLSVMKDIKKSDEIDTNSGGLFSMVLVHCSCWNKSQVRKSALIAMENALILRYLPITKHNIELLEERCRDPALATRKQSVQSLTNVLLNFPFQFQIFSSWVRGIFPRVIDPETTVQEKVIANVKKALFNNLISDDSDMAWNILGYFTAPESNGIIVFLENLCSHWFKQHLNDMSMLQKVSENVKNSARRASGWLFMNILSRHVGNRKIACDIYKSYLDEADSPIPMPVYINIIGTLRNLAEYFTQDDNSNLLLKFKESIETFLWPIQLVTVTLECICSLYATQSPPEQTISDDFKKWCQSLLSNCEQFIFNCFKDINDHQVTIDYDILINYFTVAGCTSLYIPKLLPRRLILYMQAMLTGLRHNDDEPRLTQNSQIAGSQPLSQFHAAGIPDNVVAHIVLNLGKMSFFKIDLAKKFVPAMVRELEKSESEMVRSNVLIVLTDLCVLHTQLVDPYITEMATCLRDESTTVRKHAVTLLTKLLRKEFVKWRSVLLYKYIVCTCDEDAEVRSLARYGILEQLLVKNAGDMFFRHFIELIFYLNFYEHANYNRFDKSDREKKLFDFSGRNHVTKRMEIYKLMIEKMNDDHRIKLTSKLCEDILGSVVDSVLPLNSKTENILSDALAILCSKEIKLKCLQSSADDEEDEIVGTQQRNTENVKEQIKRAFVTQVVKQNLVENIVPIIISLKNFLMDRKSRLTADIMLYIKEVMQDYKAEVQDILASDKQLASEIEFDLKRFDREQEEKALAEKMKERTPLLLDVETPIQAIIRSPVVFSSSRMANARRKTTSWPVSSASIPQTPTSRRRSMNSRDLLKSAHKAMINLRLQEESAKKNKDKENEAESALPTVNEMSVAAIGRDMSTPSKPNQNDPMLTFSLDVSRIPSTPLTTKHFNNYN